MKSILFIVCISLNLSAVCLSSDKKSNYDSLPDKPKRAHNYYQLPSFHQKVILEGKEINIHYKKVGNGEPLLLVHG